MRWILLTLLLANAVAVYWFAGQQAQRLQAQSSADSGRQPEAAGLQLLAERSAQPLPVVGAEEAVSAVAPVVERCLVLGPVRDVTVADWIFEGMEATGIGVECWQREREVETGYRVYLAPFSSRREAQTQLQALLRKGVDSFVFDDGELMNGISLGIYSSSENAARRKTELERRGYRPEISVATRDITEQWLQFGVEQRSRLASKFWSDIEILAPEAEISEKSCEPVASVPDLP